MLPDPSSSPCIARLLHLRNPNPHHTPQTLKLLPASLALAPGACLPAMRRQAAAVIAVAAARHNPQVHAVRVGPVLPVYDVADWQQGGEDGRLAALLDVQHPQAGRGALRGASTGTRHKTGYRYVIGYADMLGLGWAGNRTWMMVFGPAKLVPVLRLNRSKPGVSTAAQHSRSRDGPVWYARCAGAFVPMAYPADVWVGRQGYRAP